jgi:hypothetical protein
MVLKHEFDKYFLGIIKKVQFFTKLYLLQINQKIIPYK